MGGKRHTNSSSQDARACKRDILLYNLPANVWLEEVLVQTKIIPCDRKIPLEVDSEKRVSATIVSLPNYDAVFMQRNTYVPLHTLSLSLPSL